MQKTVLAENVKTFSGEKILNCVKQSVHIKRSYMAFIGKFVIFEEVCGFENDICYTFLKKLKILFFRSLQVQILFFVLYFI